MQQFDDEIVSGSIFRSVWKVAWPVIITQLVAGVNGLIDQILIGRYVGLEANAGVGVSWQLFLVILVFLSSLFHGMSIIIARYSGRRDHDAVNRAFFETLKASVYVLLFVIAPAGYLLAPFLLTLANASPEVQEQGLPYLRLVFTLSMPLFVMFVVNTAFQSTGYAKIPLYFGILTALVKVVVSYSLITGAGPFPAMGVLGAAVSTSLSPLPSLAVAFYLISRRSVILGWPSRIRFGLDFDILNTVARIGIPAGVQAVLLNIAGFFLFRYVGSLPNSAEAQAAYTICYVQLFSFVTWCGFGLRAACATVIGQNIGAGKVERGKRGVYVGAMVAFLWAAFFGFFYWSMPEALLNLFGRDEAIVIEIGEELLHFLAISGMFVVVALAFTGGLQGAGDTKRPMVIAFITQIVILLGICEVFSRLDLLTTTVIWTAILVAHLSRLVLSYLIFYQGKWAKIRVEIGATP